MISGEWSDVWLMTHEVALRLEKVVDPCYRVSHSTWSHRSISRSPQYSSTSDTCWRAPDFSVRKCSSSQSFSVTTPFRGENFNAPPSQNGDKIVCFELNWIKIFKKFALPSPVSVCLSLNFHSTLLFSSSFSNSSPHLMFHTCPDMTLHPLTLPPPQGAINTVLISGREAGSRQ